VERQRLSRYSTRGCYSAAGTVHSGGATVTAGTVTAGTVPVVAAAMRAAEARVSGAWNAGRGALPTAGKREGFSF
jgi:hypothetical protein